QAFLKRAGTLIFATSIVVWGAGYFPGDHRELDAVTTEIEARQKANAEAPGAKDSEIEGLVPRRNELSARLIEHSYLGRLGHAIEPAVRPLGWDWKIGVGALASFPAREVIIATLGTIYSLGSDAEEGGGLEASMQNATHADGSKVYTIPV